MDPGSNMTSVLIRRGEEMETNTEKRMLCKDTYRQKTVTERQRHRLKLGR